MLGKLGELFVLGALAYGVYKLCVKYLNLDVIRNFLITNCFSKLYIKDIASNPIRGMIKKAKRYKISAIADDNQKVEIDAEDYDMQEIKKSLEITN